MYACRIMYPCIGNNVEIVFIVNFEKPIFWLQQLKAMLVKNMSQ